MCDTQTYDEAAAQARHARDAMMREWPIVFEGEGITVRIGGYDRETRTAQVCVTRKRRTVGVVPLEVPWLLRELNVLGHKNGK